jgi:hypothetical protein
MPINEAEMRLDGYCGIRGFSMLSTTNETELPGRRLPEANWTTYTLLFRLALADGISNNPTNEWTWHGIEALNPARVMLIRP